MANIPVGLQLYTLRDELSQDFAGTLRQVAELGFSFVEFAGYGDLPAGEMKRLLDELGLRALSSHVSLPLADRDKLDAQLAFHIAYNKEIGSEYLITPSAPLENVTTLEELQPYVETLRHIAEECRRQGIGYGYHNHDFEFRLIEGRPILEHLIEALGDLAVIELDLYWVKKAGLDPKSTLKKWAGRCPLVHIKDMTADERGFFTEVGRGIINYPAIFEMAGEAGVKGYIVEQDQCERPPLESIQMSMDYLKMLGVV